MAGWRVTGSGLYLPNKIARAWENVARVRYVAHADILGMSELTLRDPRLAWSAVSAMALALQRRVRHVSYTIDNRTFRLSDYVAALTFSDTILLFTRDDSSESLRSIIFGCSELFSELLSRCVPIRVGVAAGLFVFNLDQGIFVGPPLVQAYRIGEEAQWLGAVLDSDVAARIAVLHPRLEDQNQQDLVVQWEVPLKASGNATRPVLAWPRSHRNNFTVPPPISVDQFYQGFAQYFGPFAGLDLGKREKYENTVQFVNSMLNT